MQKSHQIFTGCTLALASAVSHGHSGHDHSHWLSQPIHLLSIGAVLTIVTVGVTLFARRLRAQKTRK